MPKLPYMQFYVSDWLSDYQLALCSLATRGLWLELLCGMHTLDHSGVLTGTSEQLARVCRCQVVEFVQAADELQRYKVADVSLRDGVYTVICRRMKREHKAMEEAKKRQKKYQKAVRENSESGAEILPKTQNKRKINAVYSESESESEINKNSSLRSEFSPEPENSGAPGRRKTLKKRSEIFFDYEGDCRIHGIAPEQLELWKSNFPALDVEQELRTASAWLDGNRKQRKSDVKRFLVNWLNRAQDRARLPVQPAALATSREEQYQQKLRNLEERTAEYRKLMEGNN